MFEYNRVIRSFLHPARKLAYRKGWTTIDEMVEDCIRTSPMQIENKTRLASELELSLIFDKEPM